jgi:hypothetical protein
MRIRAYILDVHVGHAPCWFSGQPLETPEPTRKHSSQFRVRVRPNVTAAPPNKNLSRLDVEVRFH